MSRELVYEREHPAGLGGTQKLYRFDNGFGASVVSTPYTYGGAHGLWEIGVVTFTDGDHFKLTYDTPITADVLGYLSDEEVAETLDAIEALPGTP